MKEIKNNNETLEVFNFVYGVLPPKNWTTFSEKFERVDSN